MEIMKITKDIIKQLDPNKINIIELPGMDQTTMIQIMAKLNKISPDIAKQTIILDGEMNIHEFSMRDLIQFRDSINVIINPDYEDSKLDIAIALLSSVLTERNNGEQYDVVINRVKEFINEIKREKKEIEL